MTDLSLSLPRAGTTITSRLFDPLPSALRYPEVMKYLSRKPLGIDLTLPNIPLLAPLPTRTLPAPKILQSVVKLDGDAGTGRIRRDLDERSVIKGVVPLKNAVSKQVYEFSRRLDEFRSMKNFELDAELRNKVNAIIAKRKTSRAVMVKCEKHDFSVDTDEFFFENEAEVPVADSISSFYETFHNLIESRKRLMQSLNDLEKQIQRLGPLNLATNCIIRNIEEKNRKSSIEVLLDEVANDARLAARSSCFCLLQNW